MCGIAGYSGSFEATGLESACRFQSHRGPDDAGQFIDERARIGLGHVRLAIVELSALGHQPMSTEDGTVVLVFNGEIYNFREVRAELESKGLGFEVIQIPRCFLELYRTEGESMLARLNGIFAFALWDSRNQSLFIARDALGVKPLYFAETTKGFAFASEIKALLQIVPDCRSLDIVSLHRYLSFLWCPGNGTPLRGVRKVLPGEALIVRGGRITRRWDWYALLYFVV